ncbi:MAG TPA: 6,7-dimethyl-8-ribityllumazine synthase [Candidatus Polarisedimenticolaceae bacterium]|nr:6,7-dimethyl-8-ribityllumazine synthase [Candidatus Polarisedimenticolaceae bacterium]
MGRTLEGVLDAKGMKLALVVSRFNASVTERLLRGAEDCLERHGCGGDGRTVVWVPGAWELPLAVQRLASTRQYEAIVALGALIRGETPHFDVLAAQVARGLGELGLSAGVPVIFGVLTTDTLDQALERAGGKAGNAGWNAALSAVEMVSLLRRMA